MQAKDAADQFVPQHPLFFWMALKDHLGLFPIDLLVLADVQLVLTQGWKTMEKPWKNHGKP